LVAGGGCGTMRPMTARTSQVHLVGGGVDTLRSPALLAPFVEAVLARGEASGARPRLALVLADVAGAASGFRPAYVDALEALAPGAIDHVDVFVSGAPGPDPDLLAEVDGLVVGGGPTQVYLDALVPVAPVVRETVAGGVPYLGLSAGAMVAAAAAVVGGWRHEGRAVCDEAWSGDLEEVTLLPGLGLVPFTVDVHTTRAGLLGRTVSLPTVEGVERAVGLDEDTCLRVCDGSGADDGWELTGSGFVWDVRSATDGAVTLRRLSAATAG
jgi:cyanophycinase